MFEGTAEDIAVQVEKLLGKIAPGAICVAQEWDCRIDCIVTLSDGTVVGEMISLTELTESSIRATGERLRLLGEGKDVSLVNDLRLPHRILPRRDV